ncbi:hypothetical protein E4U17_003269 [Claviceps sp. LM77 group G4]|nr:hypothetical protein E4U17_003269 [Claviceps sp. LM77 group G4]KAG6081273.1 hypothetical protein E4U16_007628 [Claviceps sp. LM84 group G4]KAG6081569.1 hypothetical protein E4U33_006730 [Claviceps sp. LM78 group G4]
MAPHHPDTSLQTLDTLIRTASTLLTQLQSVLSELTRSKPSSHQHTSPINPPLNALSLAHDSATLIRAHGTKISLLIINEPFTPSAICTVLRELIAGPIPGLASAAETCTPAQYTSVVSREVASKAERVLSELHALVQKIPSNGKILPAGESRDGFTAGGAKGSLPATGLLWAACDEVIRLSELGVGGILAKKIAQWKDTLCDIMEELKEWGEEEPDDEDEDEDENEDEDEDEDERGHDGVDHITTDLSTTSLSPQALLDQLMNSQQAIPKADPHRIRPRLETSLQRLRLVTLLYQAVTKHRLKKLPSFPLAVPAAREASSNTDTDTDTDTIPARLDEMASLLGTLPDRFGDLAGALYELDPEEVDRVMGRCFDDAVAAGELVLMDWEGGRDVFSEWVTRFQGEVRKEVVVDGLA